ncbi:DUF2254 domain-containing protein [Massilia forsythiae]|uniref:DUF2254 domain-containing protein n=1 Tax=Massilia forsythiae TaxID=2728020 RepID=A0A7Z2VZT6_9BURK|nr:DUF2254 family protein [Massilia forsythiae]QJE02476.1 DUF2254 domain-containing protein [Massilia forsythiae]
MPSDYVERPHAMREQCRMLLNPLRDRLWIKPLIACALSVAGVLLAHLADSMVVDGSVPQVMQTSVVELLKIIAASMLAIAAVAVASMVSAYASAGQVATARAFPLIVADDLLQNALSIFMGAFIFGIVGISAAMNGYYGRAGRFTLFVLMVVVLVIVVIVVLTFVRWVDRIARLGRIGAIIEKVEQATAASLARRQRQPWMGSVTAAATVQGIAVHGGQTGYIQHIDIARLQRLAEPALQRAERAMVFPDDIEQVRARHADYWHGPVLPSLPEAAVRHRSPASP